jgi:hypothetical protein
MAGPGITQYLARRDYETFRGLVRKYSHDLANRISPLTTECGILLKVLDKTPLEEIFDLPPDAAQTQAEHIKQEAKKLVDAFSKTTGFFWPPEDADNVNRTRWAPYDVRAWDTFFNKFASYMKPQLQLAGPLFHRLTTLKNAGAIRPEGRGRALLEACQNIPTRGSELSHLLTPDGCEELLKDWLEEQANQPEA